MLDLDLIRIDGGTQSRVELNQDTVTEYAEAYLTGQQMPPVIVFFDGSHRWLADGFHRYFGAKAAGLSQIYENIVPGTLRDAVLYSLKANSTHGLKRSNADKRRAVETMLADAEWSTWSDRKVAEMCGVGAPLVGSVRKAICNPITDEPAVRTVERNGKTYEQDTSNIGRAPAAAPSAKVERAEVHPVVESPHPSITPAPAPSSAPAAAPAPLAGDETVLALEREVVALRESLTEAHGDIDSMAKVLDAGDQLKAALAEAKASRDLARGLQVRIDSMLTEIAELNRLVKFWKKKSEQAA